MALRVVGQCKYESLSLGARYLRELEGVLLAEPVVAGGVTIGLCDSATEYTPEAFRFFSVMKHPALLVTLALKQEPMSHGGSTDRDSSPLEDALLRWRVAQLYLNRALQLLLPDVSIGERAALGRTYKEPVLVIR